MTVRRVVPNLTVTDLAGVRDAYVATLGLTEVMNHGWILTLADTDRGHQISLMTQDLTASVNPDVSVEVDDVDAAHDAAVAAGLQIVHPLTEVNDPLANTLSVTAPRWLERLHLQFGYHVEHHLFPMVSGRHAPAIRRR